MSESDSVIEVNGGRLQDFTIDQLAGATALVLGSIGGFAYDYLEKSVRVPC